MNRKKGSRDPWIKMAAQQKLKKSGNANIRLRLLEKAGGKCHYCGRPLRRKEVTIDHKHPRAQGGSDRMRNLVAACFDCNNAKGSTDAHSFSKKLHSVTV